MAYEVLLEASPPGARIEVNGEDVGVAPLKVKIFGDPDGTFHDFGSDYYVIRALPVATNQFVQGRWFRTGHMLSGEDRIPDRIYFDMNQPPPAPPAYGYPAYPPVYYGPPVIYPAPYYYYGPSVRLHVGPPWHRRW